MTDHRTTPDYFERAFPGGWKGWISLMLAKLIGWLLRQVVRVRKSFPVPGKSWVVVTGFDLMQEVFSRWQDFPTPNDSKTASKALDWNPPYLLALREHDQGFQAMHALTRDVFADEALIKQLPELARKIFSDHLPEPDGNWREIDLAWEYTFPCFLDIVSQYYGVDIAREADKDTEFVCALLVTSGFFFSSARVDPDKPGKLKDAQEAFNYAWKTVRDQVEFWQENRGDARGAMQRAVNSASATDTDLLTSCFLGMILGFIPTSSNAHAHQLELLFKRADAMNWAKHYVSAPSARVLQEGNFDDQEGEFLAVLHECLRMNYILPGLWREANQDSVIGANSKRPQEITAGSAILVSGMAAMFDPDHIDEPRQFRPDRSYWSYLNYGHSLHFCVGWDISNAIMLEYFRALILRNVELKPGGTTSWRSSFPWRLDARYTAPGQTSA